jgi:CheY-like chemotaxis protein
MDDHNNGVTYQYQGRNIKIEFYFLQVGMVARLVDEFGNKTYLDFLDIIEEGYINDSEEYQNVEYVTQTAYQSGLRAILSSTFDLLLLDMSMPVFDTASGHSGFW